MAADNNDYAAKVESCEAEILRFLRTFESIQENLRIGDVKQSQAQLLEATADTFRRFNRDLADLAPPDARVEFHARLREAAAELEKAYNLFMTAPNPNWTRAFLYSRRGLCRGLYILYDLRAELPTLRNYFVIEGTDAVADQSSASPADRVAVGFTHRERTRERSDYSLYVPENYATDRKWPLIIALHGGYGEGSEYMMTWLRPARTKGYIVLSPKSFGDTWSMTLNSIDTRSVMRMLDEVTQEYAVDGSRIYLTGLSDGGIFTYIMGIERHEVFAGLAPVAGALHMTVDPMLRTKTGVEVPIFVVHGVHDFIFPVQFTRQTNALLKQIGYDVKYEELPDWGHALTYSINERLVMPWFETLPSRPN
jgi:phospholipase/carboxylesterase